MGSVGAPEILVILILALVVLGPERLPQAARTMGRWVGEIRRLTGSLQAEVQGVVDEVMGPLHETATSATDSFTTTFATADVGASADTEAGETSSTLAADVPFPGFEAARSLPVAPPADPSMN